MEGNWLPGEVRYYDKKTGPPGAGDDINDGYKVSDLWINETGDKAYICLDNSVGAAVWGDAASAVGDSDFPFLDNTQMLQGENTAGGTYYDLIGLNSSDKVEVDKEGRGVTLGVGTPAGSTNPLELVDDVAGLAITTTSTAAAREAYVTGFLKDDGGTLQKAGAMAFTFPEDDATSGYAAWNVHVTELTAGSPVDIMDLVVWADHGAAFFSKDQSVSYAPGKDVLRVYGTQHIKKGVSGATTNAGTSLLLESNGGHYLSFAAPETSETGLVFSTPSNYTDGAVIWSGANNRMDIVAGTLIRGQFSGTETLFNPTQADTDFRVHSDVATDAFFIRGSDGANFHEEHWDDVAIGVANVRRPGSSDPVWTAYKGSQVLAFSDSADDYITFTAQLPHRYSEGTDIEFHVHVACPDSNSGNVRWIFTYSWADIGEDFPSETTVPIDVAVDSDTDKHFIQEIAATIDGTGMGISSVLLCSLTREGTHANDTYGNDIYFTSADFHIQMDSPGSINELSKS